MMQHEFEELAGYEVSRKDYDTIIEPMYNATNLSKAEFVKIISKKRFALKPLNKIVKEMKAVAEEIKENCTHYTQYDREEMLERLISEYMERKGYIGEWGKIAGYMTNSEMKQSCSYPAEIVIYGLKNYETIETIKLTA